MKNKKTILGIAAITTGLSAGLFYGFSVGVNPGLKRLSDRNYVKGMQAINEDIQKNPFFLAGFLGAAIFLPFAAYAYRHSADGRRLYLLIIASALYMIGPIGITGAKNVPLNDSLAAVPVDRTSDEKLAAIRSGYAEPWNKWHTARTVIGTLALVAVVAASVPSKNDEQTNK